MPSGFSDNNGFKVERAEDDDRERAILVGLETPNSTWPLESSLDELSRLADTDGAVEVGRLTQKLASPNPHTYIGSGKAVELGEMARTLKADIVIFDDELTPAQQQSLEKSVDKSVKVIDRTALILDIFALHATSKEGRLQVRLAQNQYLLPRLRGMWSHLASNRMGGGVGSRFGEGESQLEVDRRLVRKRIASIKKQLEHLSSVRDVQRETRVEGSTYKVSLAGYTNAGKSSLLNSLTEADVLSYDKLFATLDSTTRKLRLPMGRELTLTDTVGFIQKLPTTLIEAFKSTLDEIRSSDLVLHVIDASNPEWERQAEAVNDVLAQIHAEEIPRIIVFNKADLLEEEYAFRLKEKYPVCVVVSSKTGDGLSELVEALERSAASADVYLDVRIPYDKGSLVSLAHKSCRVLSESYEEGGTRLMLSVPPELASRYEAFAVADCDGNR